MLNYPTARPNFSGHLRPPCRIRSVRLTLLHGYLSCKRSPHAALVRPTGRTARLRRQVASTTAWSPDHATDRGQTADPHWLSVERHSWSELQPEGPPALKSAPPRPGLVSLGHPPVLSQGQPKPQAGHVHELSHHWLLIGASASSAPSSSRIQALYPACRLILDR